MVSLRGAPQAGVILRPTGGLVGRALSFLENGPRTTAEIAEEVMALRGNPRVAAAAVFALLGSEPRVCVDGAGVWSLADDREVRSTGPFLAEEWVVVDVETTGGSPDRGHRIIEIAAVHVSGGRIVGKYASLVNPRRPVPRMITSLTGIGDEALNSAPFFEDIAPALSVALGGRIFVGHNANFDWRFVCNELERCTGRTLHGRRLCTLRVARRLLPNLPSRSLGALAHYFGIEMVAQHRALDDAAATAQLLIRLLDSLADRGVTGWDSLESFLRKGRRGVRRKIGRPISMDRA